jgi:hypothetical protein
MPTFASYPIIFLFFFLSTLYYTILSLKTPFLQVEMFI